MAMKVMVEANERKKMLLGPEAIGDELSNQFTDLGTRYIASETVQDQDLLIFDCESVVNSGSSSEQSWIFNEGLVTLLDGGGCEQS
ncbi:hypothetical protein ACE6H2_001278 [Prunus campanulata]